MRKIHVLLPVVLAAAFFSACGGGGGGGSPVDLLFFAGTQGGTANREPWAYDGQSEPYRIAEIGPSTTGSNPGFFVRWDDRVYFRASTPATGYEMWVTNGMSAWMLTELYPGSGAANPLNMTPFDGRLYFNASGSSTGRSLWATDGTAEGTTMIAGEGTVLGIVDVVDLTVFKDLIYFTAESSTVGTGLFATDGTAGGTTLVFGGFESVSQMAAAGDTLYFAAADASSGNELRSTDGAAYQTIDLEPGPTGATFLGYLTPFGRRLCLSVETAANGTELYITSGTPATTQIQEIVPGADGAASSRMAIYDGKVYFWADDGVNGSEPWVFDGINAPQMLADINTAPGESSSPVGFTPYGGLLYFGAIHPSYGREMWVTNGTAAGTTLAFEIVPGTTSGVGLW